MPAAPTKATAPPRAYGSVADAAAYSGLSPKTIHELIRTGRLRSAKVGRRRLIRFADIDAMLGAGPPAGA